MLFNDIFLLEILILLSILFYTCSTNLLILLYTGFLYLMLIGTLALINDADIYIGFLWVIDLGVGLVFFIFILHFTSFLFQKSFFNLSARHFFTLLLVSMSVTILYYFIASPADNTFNADLLKTWFFKISYMDYYLIYHSAEVTDLNTLRDTYFCLNGFEFFIVNFSLLFGLLAAILICFLIQRVFNYLNYSQIINYRLLHSNTSGFTIRNQNFTTQQSMFSSINQWSKTKS
jgi:hypothetical protein